MSNAPQIAEVAALVGDPARANILCALLGGRALTATELAFAANVTPQTTSAWFRWNGSAKRARRTGAKVQQPLVPAEAETQFSVSGFPLSRE